jgi:hypothetical protein
MVVNVTVTTLIEGYECLIGESKLRLLIKIGGKFGNRDCQIYWDTWSNKVPDKKLFKCILDNIHTKNDALNFIDLFNKFEAISFREDRIYSNINIHNSTDIQKVVDYVNKLGISDELKRCLASMILRCYVDNNAYKHPLNGCIRHYIQVLLLLGYKFDIKSWKMDKLNKYITSNIAQNNEKLSKLISDIGYPNNKYNIETHDFKDKYRELFNSGKLMNLNNVD